MNDDRKKSTIVHVHDHFWLIGVVGLVAGLLLMLYVPTLKAVSKSILLFAGFHLIGAFVVLSSLYVVAVRRMLKRLGFLKPKANSFDFGWNPEPMNGLAIAALILISAAIMVQLSAPGSWLISLCMTLLAATCLNGNQIMRQFRRYDHVVLPMVNLLQSENDLVLDAGCGAGRTTIALSRVLKNGRVVAFDRFDAGYIDEGGRLLLKHNLKLAALTDENGKGCVQIETGDLTAMPFQDAIFDSAVSTHVFDHLGRNKRTALKEVFRVLKPGGRFLVAVWTPGWTMFNVANLFSLLLTSKVRWRALAREAGFKLLDEGMFNGTWFMLLENPRPAKS